QSAPRRLRAKPPRHCARGCARWVAVASSGASERCQTYTRLVIARAARWPAAAAATCSLTTAVRLSAIAFQTASLGAHRQAGRGPRTHRRRDSPPCATVIRFRPPGKFTVAIFLDGQLPARQHLHESDALCVPTNVCCWCSDVPRRHFNSEQFTFLPQ